MRLDRLVTGITTGLVPAAAIVGLLLGVGIRAGSPAIAFAAFGETLLGAGAAAGAVLVVALVLLCGVVYVALVARERQHRLTWAIVLGALLVIIVIVWSRVRGGGIALVFSAGNLIAIGVVIAIALPIGMRFALPRVYKK